MGKLLGQLMATFALILWSCHAIVAQNLPVLCMPTGIERPVSSGGQACTFDSTLLSGSSGLVVIASLGN